MLAVDMPVMDGVAVLRMVRRNPNYKHIPVIMPTREASSEIVMQAANRTIQGYLLKHELTIDMIIEKIDACLGTAPPSHAAGSSASTQQDSQ